MYLHLRESGLANWLMLLGMFLVFQLVDPGVGLSQNKSPFLSPNIEIQNQIAKVVSTLIQHWDKNASEQDVQNQISILKQQADIQDIILQVLYYRTKSINDEKKRAATSITLSALYDDISREDLRDVLQPYLDTGDAVFKKEVEEIIRGLKWH